MTIHWLSRQPPLGRLSTPSDKVKNWVAPFAYQGGMTGPDLTSAGRRYSPHDLLDQIINPSRVINDQFSAVIVVTEAGRVHTGVVVNLNGDRLMLNTDLSDPNQQVRINRKEIEELTVSKVSPMPVGLLNRMKKKEILDLLAYIISGGNPKHEMYGNGKTGDGRSRR